MFDSVAVFVGIFVSVCAVCPFVGELVMIWVVSSKLGEFVGRRSSPFV